MLPCEWIAIGAWHRQSRPPDPSEDLHGVPKQSGGAAMPFRRDHDPKGNELYDETGLVGSSASNASMIRPRVSLSGATSDMASRLALAPATSLNEIGRAHVCTPVTNAHLVCRLLLEKKK